jgi:hypothetical protein
VHDDAIGSFVSKLKILREKAKTWKKTLQPDRAHLDNAKQTLELMDWLEEKHSLSSIEAAFRNVLKRKISSLIHMVTITARQIGKVTWCILGDEDSRFYHYRASTRLKCNKIRVVEHDEMCFFTHKEKECILTDYYRDILGKTVITQDLINLKEVYPNQSALSTLTLPFTEEEIFKGFKFIPIDKSPSLNEFKSGSGFYQDFWNQVMLDIMNLFHQFFDESLQLDRNNRSYIVLIRKKEDACTPHAYRPISLLNCSIKLITKTLALRLQGKLQALIDLDQTSCVHSRSISDSFIYALELVQTCRPRKKKMVVLKFDFSKTFDTVS